MTIVRYSKLEKKLKEIPPLFGLYVCLSARKMSGHSLRFRGDTLYYREYNWSPIHLQKVNNRRWRIIWRILWRFLDPCLLRSLETTLVCSPLHQLYSGIQKAYQRYLQSWIACIIAWCSIMLSGPSVKSLRILWSEDSLNHTFQRGRTVLQATEYNIYAWFKDERTTFGVLSASAKIAYAEAQDIQSGRNEEHHFLSSSQRILWPLEYTILLLVTDAVGWEIHNP